MARKLIPVVGAAVVGVTVLIGPLAGQAHASSPAVTDVCEAVPLPGVPPPFNVLTVCVPVPTVG